MGMGMEKQQVCRTNGIGPDIYQGCAKTTIYKYKGTISSHLYKLLYYPVENLIDIESRRYCTKDTPIGKKTMHNPKKPIQRPWNAMFLLSQKPEFDSSCEYSVLMITFSSSKYSLSQKQQKRSSWSPREKA